ncbi:hypothetical protein CMUST_13640 [Corynebacterium mustelae]|uniref:Beta-lactamase enzyme family n=1 Tax=Corynebacterium mustelae TaxID=571915 RepID=A0A0G3H779_9CORY|nr:hypothetical protein CMUST_13640 [Corynebacterium mustelae]
MYISPRSLSSVSLITLVSLSACTIPVDRKASISTPASTTTVTLTAPAPHQQLDGTDLAAIVASVEAETGTRVGIAVDGVVAGSILSGPAWSTAKVPISIAALRQSTGHYEAMRSAITTSDNGSAQQLWESLGSGELAAEATNAILREGGDLTTRIQPFVQRDGFSAFGQTQWALIDQSTFAQHLTTIPHAESVFAAMAEIAPDQRYGLGLIPGAQFKGGWGPEPDHGYLVRQFGVIPTLSGPVAVAIIAKADDYATGQTALTALAVKLHSRMK